MRRVLGSFCLLLGFAHVFGQSIRTRTLLIWVFSKLRSIKHLSNHDQGWGAANDFYKLSKDFLGNGTPEDFMLMLKDRNPIARAMGLLCLSQLNAERYSLTLLSYANDNEAVTLCDGDVFYKITIGQFAQRLLKNPYFLEPGGKLPLTGIGSQSKPWPTERKLRRWYLPEPRWEISAILPPS